MSLVWALGVKRVPGHTNGWNHERWGAHSGKYGSHPKSMAASTGGGGAFPQEASVFYPAAYYVMRRCDLCKFVRVMVNQIIWGISRCRFNVIFVHIHTQFTHGQKDSILYKKFKLFAYLIALWTFRTMKNPRLQPPQVGESGMLPLNVQISCLVQHHWMTFAWQSPMAMWKQWKNILLKVNYCTV